MAKVYFHSADRNLAYKGKSQLKERIEHLFLSEKKHLERIDYIFCSDDYLLQINNDFLQHDTYTDIITFDLSESTQSIIGEVYISIERVKENAQHHQTDFKTEIERVLFHGALHLCGFKDKTKKQAIEMRAKEEYYIQAKY